MLQFPGVEPTILTHLRYEAKQKIPKCIVDQLLATLHQRRMHACLPHHRHSRHFHIEILLVVGQHRFFVTLIIIVFEYDIHGQIVLLVYSDLTNTNFGGTQIGLRKAHKIRWYAQKFIESGGAVVLCDNRCLFVDSVNTNGLCLCCCRCISMYCAPWIYLY